MCFKTIIEFPTPLSEGMFFKNYFSIVEWRIYRGALVPSGSLSYCFGMATSGEPSTWFPLG